jgi:hypothetical protein
MAFLKEAQIKEAIRLKLEKLVRQEILSDSIVDDFKKGILDREYSKFPVAILQTASIQNDSFTNSQNMRIYTFEIVVLLKGDDVLDATSVEELRANIIDAFDNDVTLGQVCDGGMMPASSPIEPIPLQGGKSWITFVVTLECRAIKDITIP